MPKTDHTFDPAEYAPVAERIALFYERFPTGRIVTRLVRETERQVLFEARVYRSPDERRPAATGFAAERPGDGLINTVACVENTETSAVGRALANLGITAGRQRPSLEEMVKAARAAQAAPSPLAGEPTASAPAATPDDALELLDLVTEAERRGWPESRAAEVRRRAADPSLTAADARVLGDEVRRWLARQDRGRQR